MFPARRRSIPVSMPPPGFPRERSCGISSRRIPSPERRVVTSRTAQAQGGHPAAGASRQSGSVQLRSAGLRCRACPSPWTGPCGFSMTVATGSRVPLNTQAPLALPGMLSTTGHWDQSSAAIVETPHSSLRQLAQLVTSGSRRSRKLGSPAFARAPDLNASYGWLRRGCRSCKRRRPGSPFFDPAVNELRMLVT